MIYRCVKSNTSNDVIAIGRDEDQGGNDYNGIGVWANFTFDSIPEVTEGHAEFLKNNLEKSTMPALLKVENDSVVLKTLEELSAELELNLASQPVAPAQEEVQTPVSEEQPAE